MLIVSNRDWILQTHLRNCLYEMSRPSNVDDVLRFQDMVAYYLDFLPNFLTITHPLRKLLRKNTKFLLERNIWVAFIKLKNEIASDRTLVLFNSTFSIILNYDTRPVGVAEVLCHIVNEHERPIAFASRSLI